MIGTRDGFAFVESGRTYTCRIAASHRGPTERWWWFDVSGDRSRYAPFRAAADDTEASVRSRMVAYYEDRVARRGWAGMQAWRGAQPQG